MVMLNRPDTSMWNAPDALRFTDSAGVSWRVVDHAPNEEAGHCLIFLSETVVRRVRTFPKDWRRLSAAALEALTERL